MAVTVMQAVVTVVVVLVVVVIAMKNALPVFVLEGIVHPEQVAHRRFAAVTTATLPVIQAIDFMVRVVLEVVIGSAVVVIIITNIALTVALVGFANLILLHLLAP